jgi:hypothetical protein
MEMINSDDFSADRTWEMEIDEAYTELVAELQDACENHVETVRKTLHLLANNRSEIQETGSFSNFAIMVHFEFTPLEVSIYFYRVG